MAERPAARIQVIGPDDKTQRTCVLCRLDKDIRLDQNRIQASFPELLTDRDLDLLTVAAAIGYADRRIRRRRGTGWGRDLEVQIPVWDLDFWRQPALAVALVRTLELLTGDAWSLRFTRLRRRRPLQPTLRADPAPFKDVACVIPFSGGLDSMAGLQLWQVRNAGRAALRIGTETSHFLGEVIQRTSGRWEPTKRVSVRLKMSVGNHPEPTNRSRTFVFFVTAALAAKLAGVSRVLVMENGQGALGPSLAPTGDEWPYRSTHPAFTSSLQKLLQLLWGSGSPVFEHPWVWHTKAEVLRLAAEGGGSEDWGHTHSCSRQLRRTKRTRRPSCGLCGGCLLRRVAFLASRLPIRDSEDSYVWHNLPAVSLADCGAVRVTKHDENIAITNVLNMRFLAELANNDQSPAVVRVAGEMAAAVGIGREAAHARVMRLIRQHRVEWEMFLGELGPKSWVTQLGWPSA